MGTGPDPQIESALSGTAQIKLNGSSVRMTQTSDTDWRLTKTGSVNPTTQTVTWTVTATKGTTTSGLLIVNGTMTVQNTGTGPAPIGNIVVNLQTKSGNTWVTRSSVIADATQDNAATTAKISPSASSEGKSTFSENAASGDLVFTDTQTNSIFSLVPQVLIPAGSTRTLLFTASFDNNVLMLAAGTQTRVEIIVSFGNAAQNPASSPNVDINGNGIIDPEEARVRSVPARLGVTVPAQTPGNSTVTLTDTAQDITTTGTVTCGNPQFNLGATGGTVTITCDGGTSGGTVTNCAHLRSQTQTATSGGFTFTTIVGVDLTACDTQVIGAHTCTPGTVGCGWEEGDVVTFSQVSWGDAATTAGQLLANRFFTEYPNGVEIGILGAGGFSALFTEPTFVFAFLPAIGAPGSLSADLIDPTSTSAGSFAGEVLALQLNIDLPTGTAGIPFGSLTLCNMSVASLNGMSVSGFLGLVNTLLGGGTNSFSISALLPTLEQLNSAFEGGAPSTFAQQNLFNGPCP